MRMGKGRAEAWRGGLSGTHGASHTMDVVAEDADARALAHAIFQSGQQIK